MDGYVLISLWRALTFLTSVFSPSNGSNYKGKYIVIRWLKLNRAALVLRLKFSSLNLVASASFLPLLMPSGRYLRTGDSRINGLRSAEWVLNVEYLLWHANHQLTDPEYTFQISSGAFFLHLGPLAISSPS
jgi:hypothetical protein